VANLPTLLDLGEDPFDQVARATGTSKQIGSLPARHVLQRRVDGSPVTIAEFVPHDSRLRLRCLDHVPPDVSNPPISEPAFSS
jgi:hypothetical protein